MSTTTIEISPEVSMAEMRAEIAWLRNRVLIQAQAIHELKKEAEAQAAEQQETDDE
ncbi:hypothetical protein GCM10011534_12160 [Pseudooceanicola nanhaiensis]|uniref:Uncharacterized protein n=1 Tax=Pseudooceanicola nanhaiensis TaxID=375761 RepID=A0A917SP37_9RHOB|nr:hypothetical protein [Pseudooceanicola nanhaiensis]GGL91540.1 hypothetical protein GCM10011534_12160 [Pseudooceanicola nanhaiensis]